MIKHPKIKLPLDIFFRLQSIIVCVALLSPLNANALGVKDIEVMSALNQPFNARVGLTLVKGQDIQDIKVRLASANKFKQSGIERVYFLTYLKFKPVVANDGSAHIHITSRDAVREPYLDFLLEVSWGNGRFIKQFTVLLDPPLLSVPSSGANSEIARQRTPLPNKKLYGPVQEAETLWVIAQKTKPSPSISIKQMIQAIYQENPEAFARGDINLLKHGVTLRIPDQSSIMGITYGTAANLFTEQKQERKESAPTTPAIQPTKKAQPQTLLTEATTDKQKNKLEVIAIPESKMDGVMQSQGEKVYPKGEIEKLRGSIADSAQDFSDLKSINKDLVQLRGALKSKIDLIYQELEKTNLAIAEMSQKLGVSTAVTPPGNSSKDTSTNVETSSASTDIFEPEMAQGTNLAIENKESERINQLELEIAELKSQRETLQTQKYVIFFLLSALLLAIAFMIFSNRKQLAKFDRSSLDPILERIKTFTQSFNKNTKTSTLQDEIDFEVDALQSKHPEMPFDEPDDICEQELPHTEPPESLLHQEEGLQALELAAEVRDDPPIQDTDTLEFTNHENAHDLEHTLISVDVYIAYRRFPEAELILHEAIENNPEEPELKAKLLGIYAYKEDAVTFTQYLEKYQQQLSTQAPELWQEVIQESIQLVPNNPHIQKYVTNDSPVSDTATAEETESEVEDIVLGHDTIVDKLTLNEVEELLDDDLLTADEENELELDLYFQKSNSKDR